MKTNNFYPPLKQYIEGLPSEFDQIPAERRALLEQVSVFCTQQAAAQKAIKLNVICTHNSRRSHMGQLWLRAAAHFYSIPKVLTYSGGTEATAFNPRSVKAMKTAGFKLIKKPLGSNPRYLCTIHGTDEGQLLFSKKYDSPPNPTNDFGAILVCTEADAACPFIPGADKRFAIPYNDPKAFDDTDQEETAYTERSRQIAREMFFIMKNVVA